MKKSYPFIVQIMPCSPNVYLKYVNKDGTYMHCKPHCLALVERFDEHSDEVYTDIGYVDIDPSGIVELVHDNRINSAQEIEIVFSDMNLLEDFKV